MNDKQQQLVLNNINLVYYVFNKHIYLTNNIKSWYPDIIEEGKWGLCRAAISYDPNKNTDFTTLAYICIYREMLRFLKKLKNDSMISYISNFDGDENEDEDIIIYNNLNNYYRLQDGGLDNYFENKDILDFFNILMKVAPEKDKVIFKCFQKDENNIDSFKKEFNLTDATASFHKVKFIAKCKKLYQFYKTSKEFPKRSFYKTEAQYLYDLNRCYRCKNLTLFKRNPNLRLRGEYLDMRNEELKK